MAAPPAPNDKPPHPARHHSAVRLTQMNYFRLPSFWESGSTAGLTRPGPDYGPTMSCNSSSWFRFALHFPPFIFPGCFLQPRSSGQCSLHPLYSQTGEVSALKGRKTGKALHHSNTKKNIFGHSDPKVLVCRTVLSVCGSLLSTSWLLR